MKWLKDNWHIIAWIVGGLASAFIFTWSVSQSQSELTQSVNAVVSSVSAIEQKVDRISDSLASMDKRVTVNSLLSERIERNESDLSALRISVSEQSAKLVQLAIDVARMQGDRK